MAIKIAGVEVINDNRELILAQLAEINESIDDTAVDVFVYDTSKDTDGGAWRHRTQQTSWYNEGASSTRGSRKEFPAVAVIVAESDKVTIYDGDDPNLPMWMVFDASGGLASDARFLPGSIVVAANILNGVLVVCVENLSGRGGLYVADFNTESMKHYNGSGTYSIRSGDISERNDSGGWQPITNSSLAIVNSDVNDVAMTVLPDAPTDPATGLPVPTIAVATDGGVSVIKDDGAVVDITASAAFSGVTFFEDNRIGAYQLSTKDITTYSIPTADASFNTSGVFSGGVSDGKFYRENMVPAIAATNSYSSGQTQFFPTGAGDDLVFAWRETSGSEGFGVLKESPVQANGMVSKTTSDYTTGWMPGDIRLAALADTTAETLSGSELVTNDYDTYWTDTGNADVQASQIVFTSSLSDQLSSSIGVVAGTLYTVSFTVSGHSSGNIEFRLSGPFTNDIVVSSDGDYSFTATYSGNQGLRIRSATTTSATVSNISVRLADPDRSVNGNGLGVHGSITKTAVATGADVVGYEFGGDNANYLLLADGDAINPGAGDFCFLCWYYNTGIGSTQYLFEAETTAGSFFVARNSTSVPTVNLYGSLYDGAVAGSVSTSENTPEDTWLNVAMVRRDGALYLYVNGVEKSVDLTSDGDMTGLIERVRIANRSTLDRAFYGRLALMRFSATAPTADQITKIYNDEKVLFQPNAKATLTGSSDAVTALAHDPVTDLLHVGTSSGRSVFQGLKRVEESTGTDSQSLAAISAVDGLVVEGK